MSELVMTIDYGSVRKGFTNDVQIYGNCIARSIQRGDSNLSQVIEADDMHGFIAALNIALSCIDSQAALDEVRAVVASVTEKIAEANQARRVRGDDIICPMCGSTDCVETDPGEFACEDCDSEWSDDDE